MHPLTAVSLRSPASYVDLRSLEDDSDTWNMMNDNVSSFIARIGSVLEVGGEANHVSHDPYGQCHTVRLVLSPMANDIAGYGQTLNRALLGCRLPCVERFDVDLSGYSPYLDIKLESFLRMYDSTIREVRVGCGPVGPDWGIVHAGFVRILDSVKSLSCLERLTFVLVSSSECAEGLLSKLELNVLPELTNLVELHLQVNSLCEEGIKVTAPALRSFVLCETVVAPDKGPIFLDSLNRVTKISISSSRKVRLSKTNPHLQFVELIGVSCLTGDVSKVKVASIAWCPAKVVHRVLCSTTKQGKCTLRHLALRYIVAPKQTLDATHLDVLLLSNVTILGIVADQHTIPALYMHEVRILTNRTIHAKNILLSGCDRTLDSYVRAGIQGTHLKSLAIANVRENTFAGGYVSAAVTYFLHSIKDTLVRFACFNYVGGAPVMPQLRFLAATTFPDIRYLQSQLGEKQLNEFACPKAEWVAAKSNAAIRFFSKTQVPCDSIPQYWYANIGFETPLVHGAKTSWSFLLSDDMRTILRNDDGLDLSAAQEC